MGLDRHRGKAVRVPRLSQTGLRICSARPRQCSWSFTDEDGISLGSKLGVAALYLAVRIVLTCLRSLLISPSRQGFQDRLGGQQGRPQHSTGGAHIHDLVLIWVGADHTSPPACKCIRFAKKTLKSHSVRIPEQAAHDSGMMPPTHSEIIPPTVPR